MSYRQWKEKQFGQTKRYGKGKKEEQDNILVTVLQTHIQGLYNQIQRIQY